MGQPNQWRRYTQAHTGPGPVEFLSALVNHVRWTYQNRNSIAVHRFMSCRIKLPMPLIYDFSFFVNFSSKFEPWVRATLSQILPINQGLQIHLVIAHGYVTMSSCCVFRLWGRGCQQVLKSWLKRLWRPQKGPWILKIFWVRGVPPDPSRVCLAYAHQVPR